MNLFDLLMTYAMVMDKTDVHDLREAQAQLDALWNEGGGTQEEMDALCRVRGILHEELNLAIEAGE